MTPWTTRVRLNAAMLVLAAFIAGPFAYASDAAAEPAAIESTVTFFYYDDLEVQIPFYEGLLSLKPTLVEDWVRIYRITETSSVGLVKNGRGFHAVSADKPAMLSLVTPDVDAWYAKLVEAGVKVLKELPPPADPGQPGAAPVRGFIVEDPGGYTIEFFHWRSAP
jgi:catechol 2,3-dioxygenase-like lactoylglutathione lyase family enzyme